MNISRASRRSMRSTCTVRPLTIGSPYSVTVSAVTAAARCGSHRASPYERRTRWAPSCSAHAGSIAATRRAHRRFVSTSSAAITHRGGTAGEHRAAGDRERRPAGALQLAAVAVAHPDVRQQPGEHRAVDAIGLARFVVGVDPEVAGGLAQLAEEVLPLAHRAGS